jgi:hypothetical protein
VNSDGAHGLDLQNNGWHQPVRAGAMAQGHFVDVVGAGHRQGNDAHMMTLWQTDQNRCFKAGRGNSGSGQHAGSQGHEGSIAPYIMEGVYN